MSAPLAFAQHDHAQCRRQALAQVETRCAERGLRLTPVRRRALEILLETHKALGAYDLLRRLAADGLGSQPPVAYRALDFLVAHGFAHKIESLNAFVACAQPDGHETAAPAFMICRDCGTVGEALAPDGAGGLSDAARQTGFALDQTVIEAEGTCPDCKGTQT